MDRTSPFRSPGRRRDVEMELDQPFQADVAQMYLYDRRSTVESMTAHIDREMNRFFDAYYDRTISIRADRNFALNLRHAGQLINYARAAGVPRGVVEHWIGSLSMLARSVEVSEGTRYDPIFDFDISGLPDLGDIPSDAEVEELADAFD